MPCDRKTIAEVTYFGSFNGHYNFVAVDSYSKWLEAFCTILCNILKETFGCKEFQGFLATKDITF